jgi:hypothetical protein
VRPPSRNPVRIEHQFVIQPCIRRRWYRFVSFQIAFRRNRFAGGNYQAHRHWPLLYLLGAWFQLQLEVAGLRNAHDEAIGQNRFQFRHAHKTASQQVRVVFEAADAPLVRRAANP